MNTLPELSRPRGAVLMERHDDVALGELLRYGDVINRFAMQKTERRFGLSLFGRWIGFESTTSQRQIETLQLKAVRSATSTVAQPSLQEKLRWRTPALLMLTALLSGTAGMLLRDTPHAADDDGAMLVTTLKPPLPLIVPPGPSVVRHDARPSATRPPAPVAPLQSPAAARAASSDGEPTDRQAALADDPGFIPQPTLQQARALALSTNEPAFWAEGPRRGVVVVGPEKSDNGKLCRNVVVFTRINDDGGRSETTSTCRAMTSAAH